MEPVDADEEEGTVFSLAARTEYLATRRYSHPEIVLPEWCYSEVEEGRKEEEKEEKEEEKEEKDHA